MVYNKLGLSNKPIIDKAKTKAGIARKTSVILIKTSSVFLPIYPAHNPMVTPMGTAIAKTTTPKIREIR